MTAPRLEVAPDGRLLVFATKVLYILTAAELLKLLLANPAAWTKAVRRGKAERRGRNTEGRMKHVSELIGPALAGQGSDDEDEH